MHADENQPSARRDLPTRPFETSKLDNERAPEINGKETTDRRCLGVRNFTGSGTVDEAPRSRQGGNELVRCGSRRKTKSRTGVFSPFCDLQSVRRTKMCPKTDGPNRSEGTKQRFWFGITTVLPLPVFRQCPVHHIVASRAHLEGLEREGSLKNEKTEESFCISDPIHLLGSLDRIDRAFTSSDTPLLCWESMRRV